MAQRVRDYLDLINDRTFLPGLQREFVWDQSQIEDLFDSLIRGYPVGILLRWDVRTRSPDEYHSYQFLKDYIADEGQVPQEINSGFDRYNDPAHDESSCDYLIIDGQQRLNSLYIGVKGSIATYSGGRAHSRSDPTQWNKQRLCIDLFGHPEYNEDDLLGDYQFSFRTVDGLGGESGIGYHPRGGNHHFWFPLADAITDEGTVKPKREIRELATTRLDDTDIPVSSEDYVTLRHVATAVVDAFHDEVLAFEIPVTTVDKDTHEIKEIFQRINIQGSTPKPYQLLISRMMSHWPYLEDDPFNPREKIEDWLEFFKNRYPEFATSIDRDLYLRYTCYIADKSLTASEVKGLTEKEMDQLHDVWVHSPDDYVAHDRFDWFRSSLEKSLTTLSSIGLSSNSLPSMTPVALLGKFFYENPDADVDRENTNEIARFFGLTLLMSESHGVLRRSKMRNMARYLSNYRGEYTTFPTDELFEEENLAPSREDLRRTVENASYSGESGQPIFAVTSVAPILALLDEAYTTRSTRDASTFDVDHIYPVAKKDDIEDALGGVEIDINRLGNLQLLRHEVNSEDKREQWPADWLTKLGEGEQDELKRVNQYPETPLTPDNYEAFVTSRESQIIDHLADKYVK